MEIRIRATGAVVFENEFRAMFPNTGFPPVLTEEIINDFGGDVVFEGPQATTIPPYQFSQRQGVEQIDGKWFTKYVAGPTFIDMVVDGVTVTAAEQEAEYKARKDDEQASSIRSQRTKLLAECDWTQLPDAPVDQQAWANYRQSLRDISAQPGFPWAVKWPEKP